MLTLRCSPASDHLNAEVAMHGTLPHLVHSVAAAVFERVHGRCTLCQVSLMFSMPACDHRHPPHLRRGTGRTSMEVSWWKI